MPIPKTEKAFSPSRVVERAAKDGSIRWRLTERKVDREGDVVESAGGRLDNFKTNPIVLFAHGWHEQGFVPVGRIDPESMKQTKTYIDGDVYFHEGGTDPFSNMIGEKVREGFLSTGSIGFRPIQTSRDTVLPNQTGVTFQEWELMEFSVVPIPALASATARRDFREFAAKCADYGQPIGDDFMELVERHLELHGGVAKILGINPEGHSGRREIQGGDLVMELLYEMKADMANVQQVLDTINAEEIIEQGTGTPKGDSQGERSQVNYDLEEVTLAVALLEQDYRRIFR